MKYKNRSKIVSIIKMDDKFFNNKDSMNEAAKYFQYLFHEESKLIVPECLNQKDYSFNLETAISESSRNKAAGIDSIPAEWIESAHKFQALKLKISNWFLNWIKNCSISEFWAKAKIILLKKKTKTEIYLA